MVWALGILFDTGKCPFLGLSEESWGPPGNVRDQVHHIFGGTYHYLYLLPVVYSSVSLTSRITYLTIHVHWTSLYTGDAVCLTSLKFCTVHVIPVPKDCLQNGVVWNQMQRDISSAVMEFEWSFLKHQKMWVNISPYEENLLFCKPFMN